MLVFLFIGVKFSEGINSTLAANTYVKWNQNKPQKHCLTCLGPSPHTVTITPFKRGSESRTPCLVEAEGEVWSTTRLTCSSIARKQAWAHAPRPGQMFTVAVCVSPFYLVPIGASQQSRSQSTNTTVKPSAGRTVNSTQRISWSRLYIRHLSRTVALF